MNEAEYQDVRLRHAAGVLHAEVSRLATGMPMTVQSMEKIQGWVDIHRADCRRQGIDFPDMVVVGFPLVRAFEIVRKDWDRDSVTTWMLNMTVKYPGITAAEIAAGVRRAFPDYKPERLG